MAEMDAAWRRLLPTGADFWGAVDQLVAQSEVIIDRSKGSVHPRYPEMIYPLDYGYLKDTHAMDGGGVDVWVGSLEPRRVTAVMMTVDLNKRDGEIKILLGCTEAEAQIILELSNDYNMRALLVRRGESGLGVLLGRQSVRRFLARPVPPEVLEPLLAAAAQAPSAHNRQPWRFAVLRAQAARQALAQAMGDEFLRDLLADGLDAQAVETQVKRSHSRILEAPVVVLLCADESLQDVYPDARRQQAEYLMLVQSVALAGENMLLAAHASGLGGVWVCAPLFAPLAVIQALDLPPGWQPQGMLLLGYPAQVPAPRPRQPLDEIVKYYD
jgi:coenzyme F420-0:L-glutamate ligase / coenzyme F420-1:gamma-L-glutamate ligase